MVSRRVANQPRSGAAGIRMIGYARITVGPAAQESPDPTGHCRALGTSRVGWPPHSSRSVIGSPDLKVNQTYPLAFDRCGAGTHLAA